MNASQAKITNGNLVGTIRTYGYKFPFELIPNENRQSEKSPTHSVVTMDSLGRLKLGIAWCRRMERGQFPGLNMYSLILNDPSFDREMSFSAFPMNNAGDYDVFFERTHRETGQSQAGLSAETPRVQEEATA